MWHPGCRGSVACYLGGWWCSNAKEESHTRQVFRARTRLRRRAIFGSAGGAGSYTANRVQGREIVQSRGGVLKKLKACRNLSEPSWQAACRHAARNGGWNWCDVVQVLERDVLAVGQPPVARLSRVTVALSTCGNFCWLLRSLILDLSSERHHKKQSGTLTMQRVMLTNALVKPCSKSTGSRACGVRTTEA